jgi:choline dehydrogenase-like flavoprotein
VKAKVVVLSAGAVESARLLLLSRSEHHPSGIGNAHDLVGRNLQGHYYAGAFGIHPDEVYENVGPGPSIATNRWSHSAEARSQGIIGGGMLADDFLKPPIDFWKGALPPGLQRWGLENKTWMRENYKRTLQIMGPIQDIPSPHARVEWTLTCATPGDCP